MVVGLNYHYLSYISLFIHSLMFLFFFLYGSDLHLHLHSFPTRRSSDLLASRTVRHKARPHSLARLRQYARPASPPRSEEHTSELQSRPHLVCRLLLEKKKLPASSPAESHDPRSAKTCILVESLAPDQKA